MTRRRSKRSRVSSRPLVISFVALLAVAIAGIVAFDVLLSRDAGGPAPLSPVAVRTAVPGAPGARGPDLRFDASGVDFGVVPLNTEVGYTFTYVNAGTAPVRIEDVRVRVVQGC